MTWARKPPLHHTHIVIDLIDDGLGVRNPGAIIFDEVLRRRNAALVHLDQALITIPQLLPPPDLLKPHSKPQPAQCPQQKAAEYAPARWRRFVATFPLTAEIGVVSLALKELTRCDKIRDRR